MPYFAVLTTLNDVSGSIKSLDAPAVMSSMVLIRLSVLTFASNCVSRSSMLYKLGQPHGTRSLMTHLKGVVKVLLVLVLVADVHFAVLSLCVLSVYVELRKRKMNQASRDLVVLDLAFPENIGLDGRDGFNQSNEGRGPLIKS